MPVLLFLAPALTAFFLLLLFVRKRSAAGDAEALVSLISGFSGGAFPKDNPVPGDSPLYEAGEQLSSLELSPEARDYADRLESKSKYLYTMVEDLFDLSKAASGGAFRITVKGDQFEAAVRFPRQHSPIN